MNMSRVLQILFASAVVFLAPLQAQVQADSESRPTGDDLLSWCEEPELNTYSFACIAYIHAIRRTHAFAVRSGRQPLYCMSGRVTVEQTRRITVKYLREHPELLPLPGADLVIMALGEAYPCEE
jgi:Rap1a immunity proteins